MIEVHSNLNNHFVENFCSFISNINFKIFEYVTMYENMSNMQQT